MCNVKCPSERSSRCQDGNFLVSVALIVIMECDLRSGFTKSVQFLYDFISTNFNRMIITNACLSAFTSRTELILSSTFNIDTNHHITHHSKLDISLVYICMNIYLLITLGHNLDTTASIADIKPTLSTYTQTIYSNSYRCVSDIFIIFYGNHLSLVAILY